MSTTLLNDDPLCRHLPFSAIADRPAFTWPGGRRVAFYVAINFEHSSPDGQLGHTPTQLRTPYDSRNHAWREYGMRVGLWQLLALLDEFGLTPACLVNAAVLRSHPRVAQEIAARPGEVIAHGRSNAEVQTAMAPADEAAMLRQVRAELGDFFGRAPAGWLSPWIAQSPATPELLARAGYRYQLDWPLDDQPARLHTEAGPLWNLPYSIEINDTPAMCARRHTPQDFAAMFAGQLDACLALSERWPLVMSLPLHPFVIGQPFRLEALRRILRQLTQPAIAERLWFCQPGAVVNHMEALFPDGYPVL